MRMQLLKKTMFLGILFCATAAAPAVFAQGAASDVKTLPQGENWTDTDRTNFYSQDQGSQMMPLAWFRALKQPSGQPFLADSLSRYGYLPNPASDNGLPIGFTASGPESVAFAGMTCSACHTRQITADGTAYRIDGGPAIVDWQSFSTDLDAAVAQLLHNDGDFRDFAAAVLGPGASRPDDMKKLREDLQLWYERYDAWAKSLPSNVPWGPGRMDAVGMIFNRLTGLDIGPPSNHLIIPGNIKTADAPVRYPFLWNAPKQNLTQWAGFAPNGNDIFALNRNLGQVYGVYGVFEPKKMHVPGTNIPIPGVIDYLRNNSANFNGLNKLENLVKKIGPPKWPWPIDDTLGARGEEIYKWPAAKGGCVTCHGLPSAEPGLWETPVQKVGTDAKQMALLERQVQTGELEGAILLDSVLNKTDAAIRVLTASVLGTIFQKYSPVTGQSSPTDITIKLQPPPLRALAKVVPAADNMLMKKLEGGQDTGGQGTGGKYEARVLYGIWAAAPYLHNGSVPSLTELLKPAKDRVPDFKVGPAYDKDTVGLAAEQPKFDYTLHTTGCDDLTSGNSRCGHEYGTQLKPDEKKALLEYLKSL
jgi:hypothetical protein